MNWDQIKAVLQLRWQLTRNQWGRSKYGVRGAIAVVVLMGACLLGALGFAGGLLGAAFGLRDANAVAVMMVWFSLTGAFLLFWMIGVLAELQRSEAIDLQRLMHLPVRLGQIFLLNYIASHFALSIIIAVPAIFGLSIGSAMARGPLMLLMLPLALSMIFMVTAWTYCLRGWLAALMTNPRRRRSVIVALTFGLVLIAQLPNLYLNVFARADSHRHSSLPLGKLIAAQKFVPPFWVSLGAKSLATGDPMPGVLAMLGCLSIGGIGLNRAYRSTLKFYHGETSARARAVVAPAGETPLANRRASRFLERSVPAVADEASAVGFACFRALLRAPEIKLAWAMSLAVPLIVGASIIFRSRLRMPASFASFLLPSVIAFSLFTLVQFLSNQFGFDREAFQTLVLSPVKRRDIILGKNLAAFPVIISAGLFWTILVSVFLPVPLLALFAAPFQIVIMALNAAIFGNLISIYLPYKVRAASLKPTKISGARGIVLVLSQLAFPFLMLPVFLGPAAEVLFRLNGVNFPANLAISALLAAMAIAIYIWSLSSFGRTLQQRERRILEILTSDVE